PGFHPHPVKFHHRFLATSLGAITWFFIFYRFRCDGPKLLGLSHPWEEHGHGHAHDTHKPQEEHH
ncbi:uncharacterized protein LAESUDRAFT_666117, partial [Laetiporus sulphureus 93-53]